MTSNPIVIDEIRNSGASDIEKKALEEIFRFELSVGPSTEMKKTKIAECRKVIIKGISHENIQN